MSFEILNFYDSEEIIKNKNMENIVQFSLHYVDEMLAGSLHRGELLKQALEESDWRDANVDLKFLEGRRYQYKGYRDGIAIEGNLNVYEFILEGLFFTRKV